MKRHKLFNLATLTSLFAALTLTAGAAYAKPAPPDLQLQIQGPATAFVKSPYLYTVNVKNVGGSTANGVNVTITLPLTNTSPQQYLLGTLSGIDSRCRLVSLKLQCALGSLNANRQNSFTLTFALPVSTKVLKIDAQATTTSAGERNPSNNVASITPTLAYASNQLVSANVLVTSCTGRGLTSFFECDLSPGSTQQFNMSLNPGGTVTIPGQIGYGGAWNQSTATQLHFSIVETNTGNGANFNGFVTTNTCFEGLTTFTPDNGYVSPYRVCIQ